MVARKRMFCSDITESDKFLDLPAKSQALYFHLCMRSDNDGFVDTKSVLRSVRRTERYLEPLVRAGFIIRFPSGVVCIVDWWVHNAQPKWEYAVTVHMDALLQLEVSETGRYFIPNRQKQPEQAAGR